MSTDAEVTALPSLLKGALFDTPRYVMGVDPGATTGLFVAMITPKAFSPSKGLEIAPGRQLSDLMLALSPWANERIEAVVCESFHLYPSKAKHQIRSSMPAAECIGMVKALCAVYGLPIPVMQSPSVKAHVIVLPEHQKWIGKSAHVKDAYKHARYWWTTEYRT